MWDAAAELCEARLAAAPSTKELRDLVYIAETLQDMAEEVGKNGAAVRVEFADELLELAE